MELPNEFTATFFSNDCAERFDNSLSQFTTEMELPLNFGNDQYECGLSELYLNSSTNTDTVKRSTQDIIFIRGGNTQADVLYTLEEFTKYICSHCVNPGLYSNSDYFKSYLNNVEYLDVDGLDKLYPANVKKATPEQTKNKVRIKLSVRDVLQNDEKLEDFLPTHGKTEENIKIYESFSIYIYIIKWTMNELLHHIITYLIYKLRIKPGVDGVSGHMTWFYESFNVYKTYELLNEMRHLHLNKVNILVHRFIRKFVNLVVNDVGNMKIPKSVPNSFLFLYIDCIEPQIVGAKKSRVLFMCPFEGRNLLNYQHKIIDNIHFARVEKRVIKRIEFAMLNESGENIEFNSSFIPNVIVLKFRKIRKY